MKQNEYLKGCVSICLPTFNGEKFLSKTIKSILKSKYSKIEIVISDDFSSDRTIKIISSIKDDRMKLFLNNKNFGVPKNWNKAICKSTGEFICLMNHDDEISPLWIGFAKKMFLKYPDINWIVSAFKVIDKNSKTKCIISRFSENRIYFPNESFPIAAKLDGMGPGIIVRKKILNEIGYYDKRMGPSADNELYLRLAAKHPMLFSTTPYTSWRIHSGNLTNNWSKEQQVKDGLKILKKVFSQPDLPNELKLYLEPSYIYFYSKVNNLIQIYLKNGEIDTALKIYKIIRNEERARVKHE